MFDISKSIFDLPTYLRKKQPLAGSPPEQALPQPQPPVRVPYRPLEQATPRPRILSPLPDPSQRRPIAAPAAPPSPAPAPQIPSPPPTPTALSQPPAQPQQTPPTAGPATQSTGAAPKVAPTFRNQSPTTAPSPKPTTKPTAPAPQSPTLPTAQPPTPPAPSQPPQPRPTATQAPQNTEEEEPKVVAAIKEAEAQAEADSAVRRQRETRRTQLESTGMGAAATSLDALDDEAEARRADLAKKHPQRGPQYEAGIQALNQHVQQQQAQINAKAQQLPGIAAQIYQQWGKGVAGNWITGQAPKEDDPYSPGAPLSSTHLAVLEQEAKKYGVDPKDLRHHLEMQRLSDWNRASTSYANRQQENLVDRTLNAWSGKGPAEPARVLPDGRITVHPTLGEDQATFEKAIDKTYSTPEAKEAARKMWPAYHDRWLTSATETLKTSKRLPGVEDYNEWLTNNQLAGHFSETLPDGTVRPYTDNEKTQLYLDAMKSRPGWLKLAENIGTSLTAGGGQIIAGGMGLAAMTAGAVEYATGLDVGGQAFSEAAAEKAQENKALTQSHELTGTTDGFGTRLISSLSQALPSTVLGMVSGGGTGGAAIMSALQTAGGQYADTYANNIQSGMPHDEAFARSASAAAFSGVMSGLLTKAFPGGTTALSSSAIRSTLSTGASGTALRGSIKDAIKAYASTTVHGAQALARGTLDEIPQEVLDEGISQLSSAYAEKKDMKQAMADFFTGLPQLIATSGILGAGGEHIAQSAHNNAQTAQSQPQIPPNTTSNSTGTPATPSSQPPQTTVNNGQPSSTLPPPSPSGYGQPSQTTASNSQPPQTPAPAAALPVPTFEEAGTAKQTIDKLKAQESPLSAEQQQTLDAAEKTFARKTEDNILKQQAGIEKRGGKLHPTTAKALEDARATLARPRPEGNTDIVGNPDKTTSSTASSSGPLPPADTATTQGVTPPEGTSSVEVTPPAETNRAPARTPGSPSQTAATDSQPSQTTSSTAPSQPSIPQTATKSAPGLGQPSSAAVDNRQPPQTPPSRVPTFEEAIAARNTADNLKAQKAPLSPDQQQTLDAAEKTFARRTEQNILNQQAGIEKRGGKLHPTTAKALADAQAILARPGPGGNQGNSSPADNTTSHHPQASPGNFSGAATGTTVKTAEGRLPGQAPEPQLQASPNQSPQIKDSPSSPPPNPGSSSPGPGLPQMSSSGAALPSPQLQNHVRTVIGGLSGKFPGLQANLHESAGPNGYSSGMWLNPDKSIKYHIPTLAKQFVGMDAQTIGRHIEDLLGAHVQAASGYVTQAPQPKSAPTSQQAQGIPGQTAPHALSTIKTALDAHSDDWKTLAKDLKSADSEMNTAVKQGDLATKQLLEQKRFQLKEEMAKLAQKTREHVMVPEAARGKVVLTHVTPTTAAKAQAGAELAQMYTHASLLPTVGVVDFNRNIAGYLHGMVFINGLTSPSHVMHEIAHGIEDQNPRVLKACLDFLKMRSGSEKSQSLAGLTGDPKHAGMIVYKDRFQELGGEHYMGRIYPQGDGTEILTMGIERLHRNPVEFYVNDPEYFDFVIKTLQHPHP